MFFENNDFTSALFESEKMYARMGYHQDNDRHVFRFWRPWAESVFLVGDFCGWANGIQMFKDHEGIWEIVLSGRDLRVGDKYKFKVLDNGAWSYVPDPFAFCSEWNSETASVIYPMDDKYVWKDNGWLDFRDSHCLASDQKPLNIYKVNLSLWNRYSYGRQFNYKDIATDIAPYVKQMGYTHVELVGVSTRFCYSVGNKHEYSLFAPTSELGSPKDFKAFVDSMHEAGIGVILQWIEDASKPQCNNYEALKNMVLSNVCRSATTKAESKKALEDTYTHLKNFLVSNIVFWISEYHLDGISYDGAEYTLYFQLLKILSELGCDNANISSDEMFTCLKSVYPNILVLGSEENKLFMPNGLTDNCDIGTKFSALRFAFGYRMICQSTKRTCMSAEIGQGNEDSLKTNMPWFLLDNELNARLQLFVAELNHLYLSSPWLWSGEIEVDLEALSLIRKTQDGDEIIIIMNPSKKLYKDFSLEVPRDGVYAEVFNSDCAEYGGSGIVNSGALNAYASDNAHKLNINVPPYGMMIIKKLKNNIK